MNEKKFGESCLKLIKDGKCPGECCGCIGIPLPIFVKHADKIQVSLKDVEVSNDMFNYNTEDLRCMFLDRKTLMCLIYEDRLPVCKEYAFSERLPCPRIDADGNIRTPEQVKETYAQINKNVKEVFRQKLESGKLNKAEMERCRKALNL